MVGPPTSLNIWHLHSFKRVDGSDAKLDLRYYVLPTIINVNAK